MLRAQNLVKIYDASRPDVRALDGVNFSLPDRGMVFVVGKSGSGKSTLMNILGALDKPTSGEVYIDDKPLSLMSAEEADAFREEKIGFIFQDFLLFDDLSAKANVELSLDLAGEECGNAADEALEHMDMARFKERKPKQLSAGQKQRVAIARALVKHPKIIFADEPTGNIDAENTELVLDTLKEISRDALVVVISHSEADAQRYADRIIRLADGRIVSDLEKNTAYTDTLDITRDEARLPSRPLRPDELERLNDALARSEGKLTVLQKDGGFVPVTRQPDGSGVGAWGVRRMKPKAFLKHSFGLFRKGGIGKAFLFVIMGVLLALFGVAQNFSSFDKTGLITEYAAAYSEDGIVMRLGSMEGPEGFEKFDDDHYVPISDDDIAALGEVYEGGMYKLYSAMTVMNDPITPHSLESKVIHSAAQVIVHGYATETNGVLVCDIDYLKWLFGDENGELRLIAGDLGEDGAEVIVTDYILDAFIYHGRFSSAEELLGLDYTDQRLDIAGVIYTGYREKYADILKRLSEGERLSADVSDFAEFLYDVNNYLNICYSLNPDWKQAYTDDYYKRVYVGFAHFDDITMVCEDGQSKSTPGFLYYRSDLADDEAMLSYETYNALFGTNYTKEECYVTDVSGEGHTLKLTLAARDGKVHEREYRIVGLGYGAILNVSKQHLKEDKAASVYNCAVYLTDSDAAIESIEAAEELLFYPAGEEVSAILEVASIAELLAELLTYIAIAAVALMLLLVGLTSAITVRSGLFGIGMLRALGCTTARVGAMFMLQIVVMCVTMCVIGAAGCAIGTEVADGVVAEHFEKAYDSVTVAGIEVAVYDHARMAADCAVAVAVAAASGIIPVLAARRVDPVKIIRAKD